MLQPKISIIIPIYNVEAHLEKCLRSVTSQTYKNLEIILVDDGSKDGSGGICDRFAMEDSRIKVIHKVNGGVSKARNSALEIATGEYIGFVDSDDTINPGMYESLYRDLVDNSADISICGNSYVYDDRIDENNSNKTLLIMTRNEALDNMLRGNCYQGAPWNKLFKRSVIENIKFDEDIFIGEDLLFSVRAMINSEKVFFNSEPQYNYYIRTSGACQSFFTEKHYSDHIGRMRILECVKKCNDTSLTESAYVSILLCNIGLLEKLYYDKAARSKYCKLVQNNIREFYSWKRAKKTRLFQKIGIVSAYLHYRLFFLFLPMKKILKNK